MADRTRPSTINAFPISAQMDRSSLGREGFWPGSRSLSQHLSVPLLRKALSQGAHELGLAHGRGAPQAPLPRHRDQARLQQLLELGRGGAPGGAASPKRASSLPSLLEQSMELNAAALIAV